MLKVWRIFVSILRVPLTLVVTTVIGWAGVFALMLCIGVIVRILGASQISDQTFFTFVWAGGLVGFCAGIAIVVQPVRYRDRRERATFGFPVESVREVR